MNYIIVRNADAILIKRTRIKYKFKTWDGMKVIHINKFLGEFVFENAKHDTTSCSLDSRVVCSIFLTISSHSIFIRSSDTDDYEYWANRLKAVKIDDNVGKFIYSFSEMINGEAGRRVCLLYNNN